MAAYASPRQLVETLTPDAFEPAEIEGYHHVRHSTSGVRLDYAECCRLLSAVELARRHRKRFKAERSAAKQAALGVHSPELLSLLDPECPLDAESRSSRFAALRAKPELAEELAEFDRLTSEAQTKDYHKAIELHVMFEALRRSRKWTHPREVLGDPVPYPALLSIAEARIKRGDKPTGRLRQIRQLLETAEGAVTREPIKAFVAVLLDLELSESGAARAFKEASQRYRERRQRRHATGA